MKIAEIYKDGKFGLSFEVYPPKTEKGMEPLWRTIERLGALKPCFISCTYGAGGSTQEKTLEIICAVKDRWNLTGTAHFTCVGSTTRELRGWLTRATELGIENIMTLRGDPPQGQKRFTPVEGGFRYANELVALIHKEFPHFGIGVAGYPETHQEAASPEADLRNLRRKVDSGADAIFTQLFYDDDDFFRFRDHCEKMGITVPIIPGLLPILSFSQIKRITSLCKSKLPDPLIDRLRAAGDDTAAQMDVGIEHAFRQCEELLKNGVAGIHFYVLNKSEATCRILEHCGLGNVN